MDGSSIDALSRIIPRFVVGTGRCGSTALAAALGMHPELLNASELFAGVQPRAFPPGRLSGAEFWALLSEPTRAWNVALAHRIEPPEFLYPVDAGGRFDRSTGVPPIATICLAGATAYPDQVYGELEAIVPRFRVQPVGRQYRQLLGWLTSRLGRSAWFERSGGSLRYCGKIAEHFSGGRFIHLYSTGYDTALSMSRHPYFRMVVVRELLTTALGYDPYEPGAPAAHRRDAPPELETLLPQTFDAKTFRELRIPVERFGRRWSAEILYGTAQLARLSPGSVHHVPLRELLGDPRTSLETIFNFFELSLPPTATMAEMIGALAMRRRTRAPDLRADDARRLARACEPGEARMRAIAAASPAGL